MKDCYQTISKHAVAEFKDRSSRFVAYAYNVENEAQVDLKLKTLRGEHHSARHICYAYRIGVDGELTRVNDDGEPSGTAGRPIMGTLLSAGVSCVLVVVVRYFGGVLLGTSGLINAYRTAATAALEVAGQKEVIVAHTIIVEVDYTLLNEVMKIAKRRDLKTSTPEYQADRCRMGITVRVSLVQNVIEELKTVENINIYE